MGAEQRMLHRWGHVCRVDTALIADVSGDGLGSTETVKGLGPTISFDVPGSRHLDHAHSDGDARDRG